VTLPGKGVSDEHKGLSNSRRAVRILQPRSRGDQSVRITAQIGLACRPDLLISKPGFGGDEALMIQTNEMIRTLALIEASRTR
jgi:methylaspartate ammonia-lyase